MIAGSLTAAALHGGEHGVRLVGSLPGRLPPLSWPDLSTAAVRDLAPGALAIALLGLVEAVSIARSVATRSHQRIDSNQEFIGQGLSNVVGSFFSSYASSGSFTRSGLNFAVGAQTPLAAVYAALSLGAVLLLDRAADGLPADGRDGRGAARRGRGPRGRAPHPQHREDQPPGSRRPRRHARDHAGRGAGVRDLRRRDPLAGALPQPHLAPALHHPGPRPGEQAHAAS